MVVLPFRQSQIGQCYGIKVVIRESDEAESLAAQLYDFPDYSVRPALPRPLPISAPYGAE
jgi:hypothetical protein